MANKKNNGIGKLEIEGEMTIYRAHELKQVLISALDKNSSVEINLSKVSEIDSAGVQLLILAKRHAQQHSLSLALIAHSPAVLDVFELFDLSAFFGDPLLMPRNAA